MDKRITPNPMSRRKTTTLDKTRQALLRNAKGGLKAAQKKTARRQKELAKKRDRDTVAKWRALQKAGLTNTRKSPAQSHLTDSVRRSVNKAFQELQRAGHYEYGRVHHPLQKERYQTSSGKERERYVFTDYFKVIKTKHKIPESRGIIKTKKGVIVEKSKSSQVFIRNGEVKVKDLGVVWSHKTYRGDEVLELYRAIKEGDIKLNSRNFITYQPWGSPNYQMPVMDNELFVKLIDEYVREMSSKVFHDFIDVSEFHFGKTF